MSSRFARRFAPYLSKGDVIRLFEDVLVRRYGSILRASEAAGIERRTYYNWVERVRAISPKTKVKVVEAAYEASPLETLWLVTSALRGRAGEALFALVDYLRAEALAAGDREEFRRWVELLMRALEELGGPLVDEVAEEVGDALSSLRPRALELGVELRAPRPEGYGVQQDFTTHVLAPSSAGTLVLVESTARKELSWEREWKVRPPQSSEVSAEAVAATG